MGDLPDFTGIVETFEDNKIGRITLWENDDEGENLPKFTGRVSFYNGKKKFKVAVWPKNDNSREDDKPELSLPAFVEE